MSISDSPARHKVVFTRCGEDGSVLKYELEISISPRIVKAAEAGDAIKQEDVFEAFEKRFPRKFPNDSLPGEILWSELSHPITPTT